MNDRNEIQALFDRAVEHHSCGRFADAVTLYDGVIRLKPDVALVHSNRGAALCALKRFDEALRSFDRAIELKPDYAQAHNNKANALSDLKRFDEAVTSYDRAIELKPDYAEAYNNKGSALSEVKRLDEALRSFERAIELKPDYLEAYINKGNASSKLKRLGEALLSYDRAVALKPDFAELYDDRGKVLKDLKRWGDALRSFDRAIALKPDYAMAYCDRGNTLNELDRWEDALASYERAIALKPDVDFGLGALLFAKMRLCDFSGLESLAEKLLLGIEQGKSACMPFQILAISDSPELQRRAAEIYVGARHARWPATPAIPKRPAHEKIRLGYFSADYHDHATMRLMAELFERHDRSRFELTAFSFGPDMNDAMRARAVQAFERFIDVRNRPDEDIAVLARSLEIDIAIDMKGFTQDYRAGIFACRAAPIQVGYLGYPGTMGADYIDYIVADPILIPEDFKRFYCEKIVYLPNSYQVNDRKRLISDRAATRAELGLPPTGFVFCCFNNNYKITPAVFDCWMRILKHVEGSVLWLLEDNAIAARNLKKEAAARGVDAERLIFAPRVPAGDHLARHRLADLFLDTLPYNAHTTASDALWAGLPVLTCTGETFASRVAASLLNAVGLQELVTATPQAYEALAIELANRADKLAAIRQKLADNRLTVPLFDTPLYAKHLEAAYAAMVERYRADLPPADIYVDAASGSGSAR